MRGALFGTSYGSDGNERNRGTKGPAPENGGPAVHVMVLKAGPFPLWLLSDASGIFGSPLSLWDWKEQAWNKIPEP